MAKAKTTGLKLSDQGGGNPALQAATQKRRLARWRLVASIAGWYVLTVVMLLPFLHVQQIRLEVGSIAERDVISPVTFSIPDTEATNAARDEVERNHPTVWVKDSSVESRATQRLNFFFEELQSANPTNELELAQFRQSLLEKGDIGLDTAVLGQLLPSRLKNLALPLTPDMLRDRLRPAISELLNTRGLVDQKIAFQAQIGSKRLMLLNKQGMPEDLPDPEGVIDWTVEAPTTIRRDLMQRYFPHESHQGLHGAMTDLLLAVLTPNITRDALKTEELYAGRLDELRKEPLKRRFQQNETIISNGDTVLQVHEDAADELNRLSNEKVMSKLLGVMLMALILFGAVGVYLKRFNFDFELTPRSVAMHALPPLIALACVAVMQQVLRQIRGDSDQLTMLLYPSAMIGMLCCQVMSAQVAFIMVLVSCCLYGAVAGQPLDFMILHLFTGFTAVLTSRTLKRRSQALAVGAKVGMVGLVTVLMLGLLRAEWPQAADVIQPTYDHLLVNLQVVFMSGMIWTIMGMVLLVGFEHTFGVVSDLRLLELTGDQHPLLREMEEKAPGTYQHVLNVTKLAEAAAQEIGANHLLVRAGALFHDIGKMIKPKYFSENQVTLDDKKLHARLTPYMSVLIIKNHIKEGIELARKARPALPERIIDFIPQHHGTTLISYFYNQAQRRYEESEAVDPVREVDFRYPGPKPQSIETAILMLADSTEAIASSRFTGGQVNEDELRQMVQSAISMRFNDGQFDECDLTMRHLHIIREALVKTLAARYHFRISYPGNPPQRRPAAPRERDGGARGETTSASLGTVGVGMGGTGGGGGGGR